MMPSPVCLTSRPPLSFRARRTMASCARTISTARTSPRRAVMAVESTMSVNMMARRAGSTRPSQQCPAGCRIGDAAQKGLDGGEIDLDHVLGDVAMRLVMHPHGGLDVGRIDEAEAGAAGVVEPIGQEPHAVALLHLQVLAVRLGDIGGGQALQVVPVEEDRHRRLPRPRHNLTWFGPVAEWRPASPAWPTWPSLSWETPDL